MSANTKELSADSTEVNEVCRRTIYRVFERLETIKEMPDENESLNEKSSSLKHSQSNIKSRKTMAFKRKSSSIHKQSIPKRRIRSYSSLVKEDIKEIVIKQDKLKDSCTLEELEITSVKDKNYKNRGNFAILQLTKKSANLLGCKLVATPLKPYSLDQLQRETALQGTILLTSRC